MNKHLKKKKNTKNQETNSLQVSELEHLKAYLYNRGFLDVFCLFPDKGETTHGAQAAGNPAMTCTRLHCCPGLRKAGSIISLSEESVPGCSTEEIISAENGIPLSCDRKDLSGYVILDYFCSSVHTRYFQVSSE